MFLLRRFSTRKSSLSFHAYGIPLSIRPAAKLRPSFLCYQWASQSIFLSLLRNLPKLFLRTASVIRVILSIRKFLHTIWWIFVTALWHLFNMKNRSIYAGTFVPLIKELYVFKYVPGLSCRKRGSCHFILRDDRLCFQWTAPVPFSLASFPDLQLRYCRMNTGVQEVLSLVFWCTHITIQCFFCQAFFWFFCIF